MYTKKRWSRNVDKFRCPGEDEAFDLMTNAKLIYEVFIKKGYKTNYSRMDQVKFVEDKL